MVGWEDRGKRRRQNYRMLGGPLENVSSGSAFPTWLPETEQPLSSLHACHLLGGTQLGILELWGTGWALRVGHLLLLMRLHCTLIPSIPREV